MPRKEVDPSHDDAAARRARASDLRQSIEKINESGDADPVAPAAEEEESARAFVHRRMNELDEDGGAVDDPGEEGSNS